MTVVISMFGKSLSKSSTYALSKVDEPPSAKTRRYLSQLYEYMKIAVKMHTTSFKAVCLCAQKTHVQKLRKFMLLKRNVIILVSELF